MINVDLKYSLKIREARWMSLIFKSLANIQRWRFVLLKITRLVSKFYLNMAKNTTYP